jgi:DNA-binding SARP family transcriptional activator
MRRPNDPFSCEHQDAGREEGGPRVTLLGGFDLEDHGHALTVSSSSKRLIAFLALHERALARNYVAGNLWIDSTEQRAGASLRSALWRLRRLSVRVVESDDAYIQLDAHISVDAREMVGRAHRLLSEDGGPLEGNIDIRPFMCDLLPDWYEDWVILERERLRQLRLHALDALSGQLLVAERYGEAIEVAQAAVQSEPLRESPHRTVIQVHIAEGNFVEAIREFDLYRGLLDVELGVEPSSQLTDIVRRLRHRGG